MRQQARDRFDPLRGPALRVDRVGGRPHDARAVRSVEPRMQAVAGIGARHHLVVHRRRLLLLPGEQRVRMDDPAVGQPPQPRHALVHGMVGLEILALELRTALPAIERPDEEQVDPAVEPAVARHQYVALRPAGLVDQPRGARPQRVVERRRVQRPEEMFERFLPTHACRFPVARRRIDATVFRPSARRPVATQPAICGSGHSSRHAAP